MSLVVLSSCFQFGVRGKTGVTIPIPLSPTELMAENYMLYPAMVENSMGHS